MNIGSALLSGLQLKLLLGSNLVQSILLLESRSWKSISGTPIGLSLMSACSPCSNSTLPSFSLVDDQNGLNNYAEAILTEQDRFKNHSKEWSSSLTIDHPSIQVVSRVVKHMKCFLYLVSLTTEKWNVCMHALGLMLMNYYW